MRITKKYVFDLYNTLIYTDRLNNDSYNYALKCQGLSSINGFKRLTKEILFKNYPNINNIQKSELINLKYEYFINNLHVTEVNESLVKLLKSQEKNDCILWTSAEEKRVRAILKYYNINNLFKDILFSSKTDVSNDIEKNCELHSCELYQLSFYDDNLKLIKELEQLNINAILV